MPKKLLTVEDNTAPPITITLQRKVSGGTPVSIDVTDCDVDLYIKLGDTITNTGHTACVLTTPGTGIVTYTTQAADFATPGTYDCEVKITYDDGTIETIYEKFTTIVRTKIS